MWISVVLFAIKTKRHVVHTMLTYITWNNSTKQLCRPHSPLVCILGLCVMIHSCLYLFVYHILSVLVFYHFCKISSVFVYLELFYLLFRGLYWFVMQKAI